MTSPSRKKSRSRAIRVGGKLVRSGRRARIDIPVSRLSTGDFLSLPVEVLNGARPGPGIWLSGAIHGDEVIGVAIIHRVLQALDTETLAGHVIAAPIVNVHGFVAESRYLPDRRDLNRTFPGSARGSLASQLARLFMTEVVSRCQYGVDLHAGSNDRTNHPQIRANLNQSETRRLAEAFGAPVMIHRKPPRGSLRQAAGRRAKTVLVYEGGEPRRFDEEAVDLGVRGVLRVMRALDMCAEVRATRKKPVVSRSTKWVRAGVGGIFWLRTEGGRKVRKGQRLGFVTGPYGSDPDPHWVTAPVAGMVIGHTVNPLVNRGDALVHIAEIEAP